MPESSIQHPSADWASPELSRPADALTRSHELAEGESQAQPAREGHWARPSNFFITCFDDLRIKAWAQFFDAPETLGILSDEPCPRGSSRTFGYFRTRELALQALSEHAGMLHESFYTWCVIEELSEGFQLACDPKRLPGATRACLWFHWDGSQWRKQEAPHGTEKLMSFALG